MILYWRECETPVEIPQNEEDPLILEMSEREQRMRRQRGEALKYCEDVLRALQQFSQALGEAGNVGPNRAGHRASLTDHMELPYSSEIGPEFIGNHNKNCLPQMTSAQEELQVKVYHREMILIGIEVMVIIINLIGGQD